MLLDLYKKIVVTLTEVWHSFSAQVASREALFLLLYKCFYIFCVQDIISDT